MGGTRRVMQKKKHTLNSDLWGQFTDDYSGPASRRYEAMKAAMQKLLEDYISGHPIIGTKKSRALKRYYTHVSQRNLAGAARACLQVGVDHENLNAVAALLQR